MTKTYPSRGPAWTDRRREHEPAVPLARWKILVTSNNGTQKKKKKQKNKRRSQNIRNCLPGTMGLMRKQIFSIYTRSHGTKFTYDEGNFWVSECYISRLRRDQLQKIWQLGLEGPGFFAILGVPKTAKKKWAPFEMTSTFTSAILKVTVKCLLLWGWQAHGLPKCQSKIWFIGENNKHVYALIMRIHVFRNIPKNYRFNY